MKRRDLLTGISAAVLPSVLLSHSAHAADRSTAENGLIPVTLGEPFKLSIRSPEIDVSREWKTDGNGTPEPNGSMLSPIRIDSGLLNLNRSQNLTATFDLAVQYVKNIDFWVSVALFDDEHQLLGAANHRVSLELNGGFIELNGQRITLDFGRSSAFKRAAFAAISISDRSE